ncbi:MAG: 2-succinyl-5-enolpyruvyl-6-hydroxy-3-cyclohexene-1-carboxylic-acid synthase, partial [Acidimicrobiales bacterium]|nr:2-succinyl-5-enolpyruvyl-6-hydroxy-3-cyclohexene-1-carboxylic-acid synthase [Acidimicrobiales bacterium]
MANPEDTQATFCATLVDEWVRCGVGHAVVSPGSRSTPMALAVAGHPGLELHVQQDERCAGFVALGLALATGRPAIVLTTSGTAAVELHPAVVEADLARVPMLVCTADRPPELHDVGAPQSIDQLHLFGRAPRWFHAPGPPDAATAPRWRSLAARAVAEAMGAAPGPVHLNLAFREPLLGTAGPLPTIRPQGAVVSERPARPRLVTRPAMTMLDELAGRRGIFVAGAGSGPGRPLHDLARRLGWPVVASPQAPVWGVADAVIPAVDALLREPRLRDALRPDVVVRLGTPLASRVIGEWVAASGAREIVAAGPDRWIDPHGTADVVLDVDPGALLGAWEAASGELEPTEQGIWREAWEKAGR